jgi:hypothetical protein
MTQLMKVLMMASCPSPVSPMRVAGSFFGFDVDV